jgi:hypothetical protein
MTRGKLGLVDGASFEDLGWAGVFAPLGANVGRHDDGTGNKASADHDR